MLEEKNKKGQVVIWVILAMIIVFAMIFFFLIRLKPQIFQTSTDNPRAYMEKCIRESVLEATNKMLPQGGFLDPSNYKLYDNIKVTYLCQNIGNYKPCINQHPVFLNELKNEIENYTRPRVETCFAQMADDFAKRNQQISYGDLKTSVALAPGRIYYNVERNTKIDNRGEISSFSNYNTEIESPLYDIANVVMDIANNQAKYCYFEYVGYMLLYPRWNIQVFTMDDSTRIYTIKDQQSGNAMNIALKGCTIPPGI